MTLGEGKARVWKLLDEYSIDGAITVDADISAKMNHFFDIAQKHVAQVRRIRKTAEIEREDGVVWYDLPADLLRLACVWKGDRRWRGCRVRAGQIYIPEDVTETVTLEYCAVPATITDDTGDDTEFELREEACNALPFFVAAQHLIADLVIDYGAFYNIYNQMLAMLAEEEAGEGAVGGGTLVNSVFR